MDAPLYRPATIFVKPKRLPGYLSTSETAIADLQAIPAAWAIVAGEIPNMDARVGSDMIKPHLGNFSLRSLVPFGVVKTDAFGRIDAQLRSLGQVE